MTAPDTETSWTSLLQWPLFLFTENPERASCTRDPMSLAAPSLCLAEAGLAPEWHAPAPPWRPPCLTLKGTHTFTSPSQGSSLQILDMTWSWSLHPPRPLSTMHFRGQPTLPRGSQAGLSPQAPRFSLCSSHRASFPQVSPGCPKPIEPHITPKPASSCLSSAASVKGTSSLPVV